MTISVPISSPDFLARVKSYGQNGQLPHFEWESPSGCIFQEAGVHEGFGSRVRWLPTTLDGLKAAADAAPDAKAILCLTANCSRSYSRAKLRNLRARVWVPDVHPAQP